MTRFDPEHALPDVVTFRGRQVPIDPDRGHYRLVVTGPDGRLWTLAIFARGENGDGKSIVVWMACFWNSGIPWERTGSTLRGLVGEDAMTPQRALDSLDQALGEIAAVFP